MKVIDGSNLVFGRVASIVAKSLLEGEEVHIVNCENMIFQGDKKYIIERYKARRRLKNKQDPEKSPKWPNVPYMFVKRLIRGMLPIKKARGRDAFKRLKVFNGNPNKEEAITIEEAKPKRLIKYITVKEVCKQLGWRGE